MDNRYYFTKVENNLVYIENQEFSHLTRVRRAKQGDEIVAFNGDGFDYNLKINKLNKNDAECEIINRTPNKAVEENITVFLAMLKNEALSEAIDNVCELNVTKCYLFEADRSVAKIDNKKLDKLNQIAIQACKQSERARIMDIEIINKAQMIDLISKMENVFFAYEDAITKPTKFSGGFAVIIGPEGGFSLGEVELFSKYAKTISLGNTILRAQVACVASVSMLKAVRVWLQVL